MEKSTPKRSGRWIVILLAAVFFAYLIYQAVSLLMPLKTETAIHYSSYDGINVTGTIIRNETVLYTDSQGVRYFTVEDGEKVSKGGAVANIYASQEAVQQCTDAAALLSKIEALREVQSYNNTTAVDLDLLNNKIDDALSRFMSSSSDGIFYDTDEPSDSLLKLLNRRRVATNEETDYSGVLAQLNSEYEQKSAALPIPTAAVYTNTSGYFVSSADGFETLLLPENAKELTPEKLENLTPVPSDETVIGKIVSDYTWYIACTVSLKESAAFKVGDTVKLRTSLKTASELTVNVEAINLGSDKVVMVFSCKNMNGDIATVRTLPLTIVTGEYEGLRISNESIRISGEDTGVYIISGMQTKFVKIDVVHSAGGYTICKMNNDSKDSLRLYDEVVVKGRNLYDGKIIR